MVLVQKRPCFQLFFLANIGQKNVVYDILERKDDFLGYKKKKFKKGNNWYFSKGDKPWFWSKNRHFSNFFFLGNIGQKKFLLRYSRVENAFLGYKSRSLKSGKIDIFPNGLNDGFGPKIAVFSTVFFGNYRPEKRLLRYFKVEKHLSRV